MSAGAFCFHSVSIWASSIPLENKTLFYRHVIKGKPPINPIVSFDVVFQDSNKKGSLFTHLYKAKK